MKFKRLMIVLSTAFLVTGAGVGIGLGISSCNHKSDAEYQIQSVYDLAVKSGYEGSYEEWLASIKGEDGKDGKEIKEIVKVREENGNAIYEVIFSDGTKTTLTIPLVKGDKGEPGKDGQDGKSAYEIYCEAHPEYTKSEEEWLDDLVNDRLGDKEFVSVQFIVDGKVVETQAVEKCHNVKKPTTDPYKEGYTFEGWYCNENKWVFEGYSVSYNIQLTARFTLNEYNVSINYNNGTPVQNSVMHYNDVLDLETPSKENNLFVRWEDQNGNELTMPYKITDNVTITAVFRDYITFHFDSDGGNPFADRQFKLGEPLASLPTPIKDTDIFLGWYYTDSKGEHKLEIPTINNFTADITLKAHWRKTTGDYSYIELSDESLQITNYKGGDTNIVVPSMIDNKPVTSISNTAFKDNKTITSITLNDNITTLENDCFANCTALESVEFGLNITNYGERTLLGCSNLKSVSIPNNTTLVTLFDFDEVNIPDNLTVKIKYSDDKGVLIKDKLLNKLTTKQLNVELLTGFTSIRMDEFRNLKAIKSLKLNEGLKEIGFTGFCNCSNLISVSLPNTLNTLGNFAFAGCSSLKDIVLPNNITNISEYAFSNCSSLTKIIIPNSVISIDRSAFAHCSNLTDIIIPNSVTSIGDLAFYNCSKLRNVYYNGSKLQWNNVSIGQDNEKLIQSNIHYNSNVDNLEVKNDGTFKYLVNSNNEVTILECDREYNVELNLKEAFGNLKVTYIIKGAFNACDKIPSIIIPKTVKVVEYAAFSGCTNLVYLAVEKETDRSLWDSQWNAYCSANIDYNYVF